MLVAVWLPQEEPGCRRCLQEVFAQSAGSGSCRSAPQRARLRRSSQTTLISTRFRSSSVCRYLRKRRLEEEWTARAHAAAHEGGSENLACLIACPVVPPPSFRHPRLPAPSCVSLSSSDDASALSCPPCVPNGSELLTQHPFGSDLSRYSPCICTYGYIDSWYRDGRLETVALAR